MPVRPPAPALASIDVYDPHYVVCETMLSANENPWDVDGALRQAINEALARVPLHRYPDPLAQTLRNLIADAFDLDPSWVLVGNGGDELLCDLALAWGGPDRTFLSVPPTFSVYGHNARLTNTKIVEVERQDDFSIDRDTVVSRLALGDIDYMIVTSPNNPTGNGLSDEDLLALLEVSDTLVVVDEAYGEFAQHSALPFLQAYPNLMILHTFSKAYSMAGVRVGYVLAHPEVIDQLIKVRQPYSVSSLSQVVASVAFAHREVFKPRIDAILKERKRLEEALKAFNCMTVYPSEANFVLVRIPEAHELWGYLENQGVLVRDFSANPLLKDCLRISVGLSEENDRLLSALGSWIHAKGYC